MKPSIEYQCFQKDTGINKPMTSLSFMETSLYFEWYKEKLEKFKSLFGFDKAKQKTIAEWLKKEVNL